jgi:hypothetical protein
LLEKGRFICRWKKDVICTGKRKLYNIHARKRKLYLQENERYLAGNYGSFIVGKGKVNCWK